MSQMETAECRLCGALVSEYKLLSSDNAELTQSIRQTFSLVVSVRLMDADAKPFHFLQVATQTETKKNFFLFLHSCSIERVQIYDDDPLPKQICVACECVCAESHSKLVRFRQQEKLWASALSEDDPFKRILAFREQQNDEMQRKIEQIMSSNVSGCGTRNIKRTNAHLFIVFRMRQTTTPVLCWWPRAPAWKSTPMAMSDAPLRRKNLRNGSTCSATWAAVAEWSGRKHQLKSGIRSQSTQLKCQMRHSLRKILAKHLSHR